jgi:uncharacterized membrane protein (UPF0127 family)
MPWLLRDGVVLASLEVAATRQTRRRGLLGRDGIDGAMLIKPAASVHTIGMRFPIDVAHLDAEGRVLRLATMKRNRLGPFVPRSKAVLEAEAGAFERWQLRVSDVVESVATVAGDNDG